MSTMPRQTQTDDRVEEFLDASQEESERNIEVLVGLDDAVENGEELLDELVERAGAEVVKNHGFGIYKLSVPVESLGDLVGSDCLEYVEAPDPDGGPVLMGN
jgi:hypothetical protein